MATKDYISITITTMEDAGLWFDGTTLDERECELKRTLTGVELEKWWDDISLSSRREAFEKIKGKVLEYQP